MVVIAGEPYHIIAFADCLNCGHEISQGRYIHDDSLTPWSHWSGGEDCPPTTKAKPTNIRSHPC